MTDSEDNRKWYHLSICHGMKLSYFYEDYEKDAIFARVMDGICLSCPVRELCFQEGTEDNNYGLWGGVFLNNGKIDEVRNEHKSEEVWRQLGFDE